jgi:hypothetical protein
MNVQGTRVRVSLLFAFLALAFLCSGLLQFLRFLDAIPFAAFFGGCAALILVQPATEARERPAKPAEVRKLWLWFTAVYLVGFGIAFVLRHMGTRLLMAASWAFAATVWLMVLVQLFIRVLSRKLT